MKKYSAKKYISDAFLRKITEIDPRFQPFKVKLDLESGAFTKKESMGLNFFLGLVFSSKDYFTLELRWSPRDFPILQSFETRSALPMKKILETGFSPDFEKEIHGLETGNLTREHQNASIFKQWDVPNVFNEKHLERRKPKLDGMVEECCDIVKTAFLPYISLFEKYLATKPAQNDGNEPQT